MGDLQYHLDHKFGVVVYRSSKGYRIGYGNKHNCGTPVEWNGKMSSKAV